ncbi:hypothetical protein GGR52DRAFT_150172 [Hypoxylon sp. FL1284]|nr:hypothetical protein GGR52DRAFT_150172 [Hypoxylon sp. FL1284]
MVEVREELDLPLSLTDSKSRWRRHRQAWSLAKFMVPEPPAEVERGKEDISRPIPLRAFTIALRSRPIDSTFKDAIVKCDCSICNRESLLYSATKPSP